MLFEDYYASPLNFIMKNIDFEVVENVAVNRFDSGMPPQTAGNSFIQGGPSGSTRAIGNPLGVVTTYQVADSKQIDETNPRNLPIPMLVIPESHEILWGHDTLKYAKDNGHPHVPVIWCARPPAHIRDEVLRMTEQIIKTKFC